MSLDSPKRFDRIIAILIQLQSKRIVKAQELADRFEVSLRTIYRDIRSLESAGVPIASEAGVGYSIMEGYRLPPVMFSKEEAGSFVAAEKLMQKFSDRSLGAYHESAMYKIKSVLRGEEKDWISALESQVVMSTNNAVFGNEVPDSLDVIFESIAERKRIGLTYESYHRRAVNERIVEPVGLFHENGYWYLMAYCHMREDYRQFRTDRIREIKRTDLDFTAEHGTVDQYLQDPPEWEKTKVRIEVDRQIARFIDYGKKMYGLVSEEDKGDVIEMTFETQDIHEGFPRWYIMFGQNATILEPESLKLRVKEILTETLARL